MHSLAAYLGFLAGNARFLAVGFLLCFFSSFGQTFFIALFGAEIRGSLDIGHGTFGTVYSLATMASAALMLWLGALLDRIDLRRYAAGACLLLAGAALLLPLADSLVLLFLAILGLRLGGQGLMSHAGVTSMARYFRQGRGTAVGIAMIGHPAGEALLPPLVVATLLLVGWQALWWSAAVLVLLFVPALFLLLRDQRERHARLLAEQVETTREGRSFSRAEVLRDRRFHLLLPGLLAPGFLVTAFFFHQIHLVEQKGWELAWFAASFSVYAAVSVVGMLFGGPLVDRLGVTRLMPFYLLPLALACLLLGLSAGAWGAPAFMLLAGVTTGLAGPLLTAMWADVYGVAHLGAIKALAASVMVFSTALSPAIFGWLIDLGVTMDTIALVSALAVTLAAGLVTLAFARSGSSGHCDEC